MVDAQKRPLLVRVHVDPFYNPYLSDFNTPGNEIIKIEIDSHSGRFPDQIKLQFVIERNDTPSIALRTNPSNSVTVNLNENVDSMHRRKRYITYQVNSYLRPNSLIIKGEDTNFFLQSTELPEGTYVMHTTLVEPRTSNTISNTSSVTLHIKWLAAPVIHKPVFPDMRTAVFNWSASEDSITRLFTTTYFFEMAVLSKLDNLDDPKSAFTAEQLIYSTMLETNSVKIDSKEVKLIPGQGYAVRVRAYHPQGKDLFRNAGMSKIYVFKR